MSLLNLALRASFYFNNKRAGEANIQIRLDRGIVITEWRLLFSKTSIIHLSALSSDHDPILFNTTQTDVDLPKLFHIFTM